MSSIVKKLFISVADLSAEKYAYFIINEILKKTNNVEILAVGGSKLKQLTIDINKRESYNRIKFIADSIKYSSIGFFENLTYIPFAYIEYLKLKEILKKEKPKFVLLIDAPFLNVRLIKYLKSFYDPIIFYLIPPKTWLNKKDFIHKFIEDTCDYIILPFRFNLGLYNKGKSYFFGHPLLDITDSFNNNKTLKKNNKNLAIFPGSRKFEILFVSKDAFNVIYDRDIYKTFDKFLISNLISDFFEYNLFNKNMHHKFFVDILKKGGKEKINNIKIEIVKNNMDIYENSLLALSKSGTIVFENILNNLPTITYYKVLKISELTFKLFQNIKIKYISIPNLLVEYEFKDELISNLPPNLKNNYIIVEELIQDKYNLNNLKQKLFQVYNNIDYYNFKIEIFNKLLKNYYPSGSLKKIVDLILNVIEDN